MNLLAGAIVAGMPSALTGALAQYMEGARTQMLTSEPSPEMHATCLCRPLRSPARMCMRSSRRSMVRKTGLSAINHANSWSSFSAMQLHAGCLGLVDGVCLYRGAVPSCAMILLDKLWCCRLRKLAGIPTLMQLEAGGDRMHTAPAQACSGWRRTRAWRCGAQCVRAWCTCCSCSPRCWRRRCGTSSSTCWSRRRCVPHCTPQGCWSGLRFRLGWFAEHRRTSTPVAPLSCMVYISVQRRVIVACGLLLCNTHLSRLFP